MIRIAIIQDNMQFVPELPCILETGGDFYITRIYHFMEDALADLQEYPVDIVIVDILSRDNSGIEWMREIKSKTGICKWLVYSDHDNEDIIIHALRAGANGYILKDTQHGHLRNAMHELINGGAPMSPPVIKKVLAYFHNMPKKESYRNVLSHREKEILHFTSRGLLYKEIAQQLGIQRETVKKHLSKVYEKLQVQNKIEALNKFYGL